VSAGFDHDPLADVGELHQVLRDQYPASAIPKELIQNADDAKATTLHFAWSSGWANNVANREADEAQQVKAFGPRELRQQGMIGSECRQPCALCGRAAMEPGKT
jgi:hypothetical protein